MINNSKQLVWVTSKLLSNNALSFATMYNAIQCKTKPKNYETRFFLAKINIPLVVQFASTQFASVVMLVTLLPINPRHLLNFMLQCLRTFSISRNFPKHLGTLCFALLWSQLIWLDPIWAKKGNHFYPLKKATISLVAFLDRRNSLWHRKSLQKEQSLSVFKAFIFPSLYNLILVSRFLHI